ncbi:MULTISPECIES: hypothetical protein [Ensifer]|jgi:hypothetical protein|uniref:hypothetical protein n=1 Tax=Ensifer TaxID=106591 RepID=UPI00071528D0|nr:MULTISPECIES: hypothetical protein [Ensifer]KQX72763.1 hypothetical protein ASD41_11675 [Ensifer sp. Root1312]KRD59004.1 hypothetical protein ASE71_09305 [Ensifer sp. Root954]
MITFTWANGQKFELDGTKVLRIRKTIKGFDEDLGNTLLDVNKSEYVQELPPEVVTAVQAELSTLSSLTQPVGERFWFNAQAASGPMPVGPSKRKDGILSAFDIGGKRQYVREPHEEVAALIKAARGDLRPVPDDSIFKNNLEPNQGFDTEIEEWDAALNQTTPDV